MIRGFTHRAALGLGLAGGAFHATPSTNGELMLNKWKPAILASLIATTCEVNSKHTPTQGGSNAKDTTGINAGER
jgi:hypothetical protein